MVSFLQEGGRDAKESVPSLINHRSMRTIRDICQTREYRKFKWHFSASTAGTQPLRTPLYPPALLVDGLGIAGFGRLREEDGRTYCIRIPGAQAALRGELNPMPDKLHGTAVMFVAVSGWGSVHAALPIYCVHTMHHVQRITRMSMPYWAQTGEDGDKLTMPMCAVATVDWYRPPGTPARDCSGATP
jgi:hypothetical protein